MHKNFICSRELSRERLRLFYGAIVAILIGSASSSTSAQTPSFPDLLRQAQINAPQLLEQAANVRAANADFRQARAWNNPTLSATTENLGAPELGGASQRQDTYTLNQVFEIGGKRSARIEAEQTKSIAVGARERQTRILFANGLAVAYATAEALQLRKEVADAELLRADDDLRAATALVRAGRETELRLVQARASVAASQAALLSSSADAFESLARLSVLVGAQKPFNRIDHSLLLDAAVAPAATTWVPEDTPALTAAAAERDAVRAQMRVEEKRWLPDVGLSVGIRKFGWTSDTAKTIAVTTNIPLFDRNQNGISAAKERANSADFRLEGARLDVIASHRSATMQVLASVPRLLAAEQGEAAAIEAYRLGRVGYDAGKTPLVELLAIRRALSEAKSLTIEARLDRVRALATLSTAEGRIAFGETP